MFIYNSFLARPSPPVSLTADFNSPTCSGAVQLAWTPGASDRDIEMYFLSLNGVLIASLGPSERNYTHNTTLQRDTEYTYSVVAMSCAGDSTAGVKSVSIGGEVTCLLLLFVYKFSFVGFSLSNNPPIFLSYDNISGILTVDWVNNNKSIYRQILFILFCLDSPSSLSLTAYPH